MTQPAIENALHHRAGKSFSDGTIVVGISDPTTDEVAISFNNTKGAQFMVLKLSRADADTLSVLLQTACDALQTQFVQMRQKEHQVALSSVES